MAGGPTFTQLLGTGGELCASLIGFAILALWLASIGEYLICGFRALAGEEEAEASAWPPEDVQ